jgi:anti-sigma regulatory factor (Ser/Thr protein kinase)
MNPRLLTIQAHHDQIAELCDLILQVAQQVGFDETTAYSCSLATAEACENIIHHGYTGETDLPIAMTLNLSEEGSLIIVLIDEAPAFNASEKPVQPEWSSDDPPVGGLGLQIIHRVMDKVLYKRIDTQNILTMIKHSPK